MQIIHQQNKKRIELWGKHCVENVNNVSDHRLHHCINRYLSNRIQGIIFHYIKTTKTYFTVSFYTILFTHVYIHSLTDL